MNDTESKYSKREVNQARESHQIQKLMANPPDAELIKALTSGTQQNTTVMPLDVARATNVFGPGIGLGCPTVGGCRERS